MITAQKIGQSEVSPRFSQVVQAEASNGCGEFAAK
jgi:hypothetical protein